MSYDPNKHHRRSIRLRGYDYSQKGIYFVTFVRKTASTYSVKLKRAKCK